MADIFRISKYSKYLDRILLKHTYTETCHIPKRSFPVSACSVPFDSVVRPPVERATLFARQFLKSPPQTSTDERTENSAKRAENDGHLACVPRRRHPHNGSSQDKERWGSADKNISTSEVHFAWRQPRFLKKSSGWFNHSNQFWYLHTHFPGHWRNGATLRVFIQILNTP